MPSVAVLDGDFVLRYRGRVDDRYGASSGGRSRRADDLAEAIDEVLAGRKVAVAETEVDGCLLQRVGQAVEKTNVTYAKDVAPILQKRCQACHRRGQNAPFSLRATTMRPIMPP